MPGTSVMLLEVTDPVWPRGTSVPATRLEGAPQPPRQEGRPLERQAPGPCGRLRRTRRWLADQAEGVGAGASAPPDPRAEKTATRAAISSGVASEFTTRSTGLAGAAMASAASAEIGRAHV